MTIFRNYTIPENAKYIRFDWQTEKVNGDIVYAFAGSYTEDTFPPYEPYGYKIPIEVGGKNLFGDTQGLWVNVDGSVVSYYGTGVIIPTTKNNKFTVYAEWDKQESSNIILFACFDSNMNFISGSRSVRNNIQSGILTKTCPDNTAYLICCHYNNKPNKIFLVEGAYTIETMPPYEPYKEPIVTNIYLDEPLYKIGGSADYIDFKNGKVVRKNKKVVLDALSTDEIKLYSAGFDSIRVYMLSGKFPDCNKRDTYNTLNICNKFKNRQGAAVSSYTEADSEWLAIRSGTVYVAVKTENLSEATIVGFMEYINSLNAQIIYQLGEEVEEDIALPEINTHKDTNVISVGTEIPPSICKYNIINKE
jgi:hypothetical protein